MVLAPPGPPLSSGEQSSALGSTGSQCWEGCQWVKYRMPSMARKHQFLQKIWGCHCPEKRDGCWEVLKPTPTVENLPNQFFLSKFCQNAGFPAILNRILIQDYRIKLKQQFHIFHISPISNLIKVSEKTRLSFFWEGGRGFPRRNLGRSTWTQVAGTRPRLEAQVLSTVTLGCIKIEKFYMAESFTHMSTDKWRICKK